MKVLHYRIGLKTTKPKRTTFRKQPLDNKLSLRSYLCLLNLFKVNNKNSRTTSLLTLNRSHTLFWCFYCWIWTGICGLNDKVSKMKPMRTGSLFCEIYSTHYFLPHFIGIPWKLISSNETFRKFTDGLLQLHCSINYS